MENRVKDQLDKEHSKRFKTMCHRNSIIGKEHRVLQSYYDNEKKKKTQELENKTEDLQKILCTLSQEKSINKLLKELTSLAFTDRDAHDAGSEISSETTKETPEDTRECRYLRIESNPFHPSEMSFDHSNMSLKSLSTLTEEESVLDNEFVESEASSMTEMLDTVHDKKPVDMKGVVDKLVGHYDVDKLKFLTQVLMKTLHTKDRVHYEDQLKLIYNLSRYFSEDNKGDKENAEVKKVPGLTSNTFLFLKSDRQKAIKEERASKAKLPQLNRNSEKQGKMKDVQLKHRRHSLPVVKHLPEIDTSPTLKERRFSAPAIVTETDAVELENDVMRIYLKLGHGALLTLPTYNKEEVKRKQRNWTRKGLKESSTSLGIEDLRTVMRHCRYLRLPKDLHHD